MKVLISIIIIGLLCSGCQSITIKDNRGTIHIDQTKSVSPNSTLTGLPGF